MFLWLDSFWIHRFEILTGWTSLLLLLYGGGEMLGGGEMAPVRSFESRTSLTMAEVVT